MSASFSWRRVGRAVTAIAVGATAVALALRILHYSPLARWIGAGDVVGALLRLQFSLILVQLTALLPVSLALGLVTVGLWRLRPSALVRQGPEGWKTRPWFSSLLWTQIFLLNFLIDIDPRLAIAFGAGILWHLVLASAAWRRWMNGQGRALRWLSFGGVLLLVAPWQLTWSDRLCLAVWYAGQPALSAVVGGAAHWTDRLWPATLGAMGGQLMAAATPYFISDPTLPLALLSFGLLRATYNRLFRAQRSWYWRLPLTAVSLLLSLMLGWEASRFSSRYSFGKAGTRMGEELAYNFCENVARGRLAVTVPVCSGPGGPQCVRGRVDLFDLDSLALVESLRPFDGRFYGRLEQVVCEDDVLLVGMCCVHGEGKEDELATMSIDWKGKVLEPSLLDEQQAHRVLPDRKSNGLWLAGRELVRKNLSTGETKVLAKRRPPGIFVLESGAGSERRKSVFVGEFINGDAIREFGLESVRERRRLVTNNGSVVAVTVDDAAQRLYVTGLWGVAVYDIDSGTRLSEERLGFATRTPLVDERHDLVYIPSTTNGKIQVLDRTSGELLGALSIGFGARNVFLANEGRWFLASSQHGLWYWESAALAARFRAGPSPAQQRREDEGERARRSRFSLPISRQN